MDYHFTTEAYEGDVIVFSRRVRYSRRFYCYMIDKVTSRKYKSHYVRCTSDNPLYGTIIKSNTPEENYTYIGKDYNGFPYRSKMFFKGVIKKEDIYG